MKTYFFMLIGIFCLASTLALSDADHGGDRGIKERPVVEDTQEVSNEQTLRAPDSVQMDLNSQEMADFNKLMNDMFPERTGELEGSL